MRIHKSGFVELNEIKTHRIFIPESGNTLIIDDTPPTTTLTIGEPKYMSDKIYVTPDTPFTVTASDVGSGVKSTTYRIANSTGYDSGWLTYTKPFNLTSLRDGNYTIAFNSTDNVGNVETTHQVNVTLFSWTYVYKDSDGRGTVHKISIAYKFFQFTAPTKGFGVKYDPKMFVKCGIIVICYGDTEMRLTATAVDSDFFHFCTASAYDKQTRKTYVLVDRPYGPRCLRLYDQL